MRVFFKSLSVVAVISGVACFVGLKSHAGTTSPPLPTGPVPAGPVNLWTLGSLTDAQLEQLIRVLAATPTTTPGYLPIGGTFYSLQHPDWPPLPGDVQQVPAWDFGSGFFLLDDLGVNYTAPLRSSLVSGGGGIQPMGISPPGGGGGGGTNVQPQGTFQEPTTNDLWLAVSSMSNAVANLVIHYPWNETNGMWDVFGTTNLAANVPGLNVTNWVWLYRTEQWQTNVVITNLWPDMGFFRLGTMQDSDGDGLSDAYEKLVSHTNPNLYSSDGTGMSDGWEIQYFGHTGVDPDGDPDGDGLTTYQEWQMRSAGYNPMLLDSNTNGVGDGYEDYSGDGLANLMEAAFDGDMMSSNSAWEVDSDGDGLPDSYETMAGSGALGLPSYSKNPIQ